MWKRCKIIGKTSLKENKEDGSKKHFDEMTSIKEPIRIND